MTWSCDARCGSVIGGSSLELHPLANGHQHVAFTALSNLLSTSSSSFLPDLTVELQLSLLVGQRNSGRIGCSLTTPGHQRQSSSIIPSCKCWWIWAFFSPSHFLCSPASINCPRHIRHSWDFYWDNRSTNWYGTCARNWAWTPGGRFWRRSTTDCGNPRGDDNWAMACRIGSSGIIGAGSRIKPLTWTQACNDRTQMVKKATNWMILTYKVHFGTLHSSVCLH